MLTEAAINSLNRVLQHFDRNAFAIISASRHIYSEKENEARTAELKDLVRKMGYGFVKMKGRYIEGFGTEGEKNPVSEDVLFIASRNMNAITDDMTPYEKEKSEKQNQSFNSQFKIDMAQLGEKFDQEAIIFKPFGKPKAYLMGTTDVDENGKQVYPGKGVMVVAGVSDEPEGKPRLAKSGMFSTMLWKNKRSFTIESLEYPKNFFGSWCDFLHKKMIQENKNT